MFDEIDQKRNGRRSNSKSPANRYQRSRDCARSDKTRKLFNEKTFAVAVVEAPAAGT